jgi:hypothetical protein
MKYTDICGGRERGMEGGREREKFTMYRNIQYVYLLNKYSYMQCGHWVVAILAVY